MVGSVAIYQLISTVTTGDAESATLAATTCHHWNRKERHIQPIKIKTRDGAQQILAEQNKKNYLERVKWKVEARECHPSLLYRKKEDW
jgi:heme A synthase